MIFAPCTEREAIYAACLDRDHCLEYLDREFDDDECDIVATAMIAMPPDGAWQFEGLLAKVIEIGVAGDVRRILAAACVVKPEVEWFRELCMTAGRSVKEVARDASMSLDELIERRAADRPDDAHEVVWSSHQQGEK